MAINNVITAQTGGRQFNGTDFTKYSMFVGGTNATHHALLNYSPLMNGFVRIFIVRSPYAIARMFAGPSGALYSPDSLFVQFKHALEYMCRSITGFGDKTIDKAGTAIQGGFAGRSFNTPTVTRDTTESVTIGLYELTGSPIYTVIDGWMNAIGDENSGYATYGGYIGGGYDSNGKSRRLYKYANESNANADGIEFNEANHTMEAIVVLTDRSGAQVERAVMLADMYPLSISQSAVLDMAAGGGHDNVTYDLQFNCVAYRSVIINAIADDLLKQYRIVSNSLNFNPQLGDAVYGNNGKFNRSLGEIPFDSASGTNIGNIPSFTANNTPKTRSVTVSEASKSYTGAKYDGNETYNGGTHSIGYGARKAGWDGFENS